MLGQYSARFFSRKMSLFSRRVTENLLGLLRHLALCYHALKGLVYSIKYRDAFTVGKVRKVGPASVVVLHRQLADGLPLQPCVGWDVLDTEHHVAAESNEVGRLAHGTHAPAVGLDDKEQDSTVVHRTRFNRDQPCGAPGRWVVEGEATLLEAGDGDLLSPVGTLGTSQVDVSDTAAASPQV